VKLTPHVCGLAGEGFDCPACDVVRDNQERVAMNETTQRSTDGPWEWTHFCKPNGDQIHTVADVAETIAGSALHSERAELWGVTLNDALASPDGRATVVCYTGNGPNAHNNARVIAGVPIMVEFLRRLVARDQGFVYSRDEKDAHAILRYIDGYASIEDGTAPENDAAPVES
jgi:hypothetical protein